MFQNQVKFDKHNFNKYKVIEYTFNFMQRPLQLQQLHLLQVLL